MNYDKYIKLYLNGDKKAFDVLYKNTINYVRIAIYQYVTDRDVIEDLAQDTYLKVMNSLNDYRSKSFPNWVYTIAKNKALDYLKSIHTEPLAEGVEIPDKVTNPYLKFAIKSLDNDEREVFLLKVLCGYTTRHVMDVLGLPNPAAVNTLYYQAKAKLKKYLEEVNDEVFKV